MVKPNTDIGQHFLIDRDVLREVVRAAELSVDDTVLEIGPGTGILTAELAAHAKRVVAVELDRRCIPELTKRFVKKGNVEIVHADVVEWWGTTTREQKIKRAKDQNDEWAKFKLVANLPYNITSRVLRIFLEHPPRPSLIVVMVQKEVAERVCATPGQMSLLSLSVQYYGDPEIVGFVPPESFDPPPAVESVILRIRVHTDETDTPETTKRIFQLARMGFSSRRKQLANLLAPALHLEKEVVQKALVSLGLPPLARAQELSVAQWRELAKRVFVQEK